MKQGWEIKKLGDVCYIKSSNVSQNQLADQNGAYPIFGASGLIKNIGFYHRDTPYLSIVKDGSGFGRITKMNAYTSVIGTLQYILPLDGLDLDYLYYSLISIDFKKYVSGAAIPHIYFKDYKNEPFLWMPLPEQQRIVAILDDAFAKIEKAKSNAEQNLKNVKELFESLLWDHLSGSRYLSNTSNQTAENLYKKILVAKNQLINDRILSKKNDNHQDPIKEIKFKIPDNWRWCYLSDISIIQEGPGIRKHQYTKDGVQFLTVTNILEGRVDLKNVQKFVSTNDFKKYKHFTINPGDIVTACSGGSWGKSAIFDSDVKIILNTSTLRLRYFNDLSLNKHLYYLTKTQFFKNQLSRHSTGQQPNYGYLHYSQIEIPLPPLEIQISIVKRLDVLEEKCNEMLNYYERELNNLEELKKSILLKAFNGEL